MPSNGPSAWRLNKAEQTQVERDLQDWEGALPADMPEEEKVVKRGEERKRLTRVLQQAKHERSLQKQHDVGSRAKGKGGKGAKGAALGAPSDPVASASDASSSCNGDYFELVKQDLAVIHKVLGNTLKDKAPLPISTKVDDKSGIQDSSAVEIYSEVFDTNYFYCLNFFFSMMETKDPYSLEKAKVALGQHGVYISSCNLLWLDAWKSPSPGVPLQRERVEQLANFYFPPHRTRNFFTKLLDVQVDTANLSAKPSGLVMISPLEIVHAIYLKASQELGDPSVTAKVKNAWKETLPLVVINNDTSKVVNDSMTSSFFPLDAGFKDQRASHHDCLPRR